MEPTQIDQFNNGGREALTLRMASFYERQKPLEFVMLGYPFKSTNHRDKTIGTLPDMAEEVSMKNFKLFGDKIADVYPPGIRITVISDGYVFNDILEEQDYIVDNYGEIARDLAKDTPVQIMSLRDFYPEDRLNDARGKVISQFGITDTELEHRVLFDPNVNSLYRGMIRFMEEELANRSYPSHRKLHLAAKTLARQMMFRNEAYSHLVSAEFKTAIRLSMHPSTNIDKYSFQLIPGKHNRMSPWHCAVLWKDGTYSTIHKKDAEAAGHELVSVGGRPYFYV